MSRPEFADTLRVHPKLVEGIELGVSKKHFGREDESEGHVEQSRHGDLQHTLP